MPQWQYNPEQYDPNQSFEPIPPGKHRVRIEEAEEQKSKSGNEMIKLTLSVSGSNARLFHYVVFMPDRPQITNQNLGALFDSFGIKPGDMNLLDWRGKVGVANVKHEMYNGVPQARIAYFVLKSKQGDLPAWREKKAEPSYGSLRDEVRDGEADTPF